MTPRIDPADTAADQVGEGWTARTPTPDDVEALAELARAHEQRARGWSSTGEEDVLLEVSAQGYLTRENVVLADGAGTLRGWASAHDRAAGRMLLRVLVDERLEPPVADAVARALLRWSERAARVIGAGRGLATQQIDTGSFADDPRQERWLSEAGYQRVRSWWQMTRPVTAQEDALAGDPGPGVRIRLVERQGSGMPSEEDLRIVHDVLESAFADHFNSHEETFDEFVSRLREDPGHRWDHWWIAELVDEEPPEPAGALVGAVHEGGDGQDDSSYVEYIGVLANARGRGVAKSLLRTIIADAATSGRSGVGLEVDADSPTGAEGLYQSMGWRTRYVTRSWHRGVTV